MAAGGFSKRAARAGQRHGEGTQRSASRRSYHVAGLSTSESAGDFP